MSFWRAIPDVYKKWGAFVLTLIAAGFMLRDFYELPGIVKSNTERIQSVEQAIRGQEEKLDQMLCLQIVDKTGGQWEDCVGR